MVPVQARGPLQCTSPGKMSAWGAKKQQTRVLLPRRHHLPLLSETAKKERDVVEVTLRSPSEEPRCLRQQGSTQTWLLSRCTPRQPPASTAAGLAMIGISHSRWYLSAWHPNIYSFISWTFWHCLPPWSRPAAGAAPGMGHLLRMRMGWGLAPEPHTALKVWVQSGFIWLEMRFSVAVGLFSWRFFSFFLLSGPLDMSSSLLAFFGCLCTLKWRL